MTEERARELLALAEAAEAHETAPDAAEWRNRVADAGAELAEAAELFLRKGAVAEAQLSAAALRIYWQQAGRVDEGRRLVAAALAAGETPAGTRAKALGVAGELAFRQGENETADALSAEAHAVASAAGDVATAARALVNRARVAYRDGDAVRIERHARAALDLAGAYPAGRSGALHMLAWAAHTRGDLDGARELFLENLALARDIGNRVMAAGELANLGDLAREQGDVDAAARHLAEALAIAVEIDSRYLLPSLLGSLAGVAADRGDAETAARLAAAARAQYEAAGLTPDPGDAEQLEDVERRSREALGDGADSAFAAGRGLSLEQAVAEARAAA